MDKLEVKIVSSVALKDSLKSKVEKFCKTKFNNDIKFIYSVDSSIIGGIIIFYEDFVYDGSVLTQLRKIALNLEQ